MHLGDSAIAFGLHYVLMGNSSLIAEQLAELGSPLQNGRVFYPLGYTIHEGFLPSLLALLLSFGNPLLGANLSMLLSWVVAGVGGYCLAYEVSGNRTGSFLAGAFFSFGTFHYVNQGGYPNCHLGWIPLFVYAVLAFLRTGRRGMLALIAAAFTASALSSWYFAVFNSLTAGLLGIFALTLPQWRRRLVPLAAILAANVVCLIPFSPAALLGRDGLATGGFKYFVDGSADLLSFLLVPISHWKLAAWSHSVQRHWMGNLSLQGNYLGTVSLLLAVWAAFRVRVKPAQLRYFFIVLAIVSFVLALGPFLVINGPAGWKMDTPPDEIPNLRLPYYWLTEMFPFSATRAVSRYSILTLLAISVFLALGIGHLLRKSKSQYRRWLVTAGVATILMLELWPPWPHTLRSAAPVSSFYDQLASDSDDFAVLQVPFRSNAYRYLYLSSLHNKKVVGGVVDKPFIRFKSWASSWPFLRALMLTNSSRGRELLADGLYAEDKEDAEAVLKSLNVRYVVLHKWDEFVLSFTDSFKADEQVEACEELLEPLMDKVFEDDTVRVYKMKQGQSDWLFQVTREGWGGLEIHGDYADRPMLGSRGTLEIHSSGSALADLEIKLAVILEPERQAHILLNGEVVWEGTLSRRSKAGDAHSIRLSSVELNAGANLVEITTPEPVLSIAEVYGGTDTRKISFLLSGVSLERSENQ
jgi:hypothetical protein